MDVVTGTVIEALWPSVTVSEQLPVSLPGCSVNDADVTPALNVGAGVAELVSNATYGLEVGTGLGGGFAVHATEPLNVVATLPASVTPTVCGAGLFTSKVTDPGEATAVGVAVGEGDGDGVGDGDGEAVAVAVGIGVGLVTFAAL